MGSLLEHIQCEIKLFKSKKFDAVAQLVEALRYKSEGRRFDSRGSH
jgi:hypothetical protein